eukprot:UN00586
MNSDNCLLSGRTMDYGPFGWVEKYAWDCQPFTSDPDKKYAFENQPRAAQYNLVSFANTLVMLTEDKDVIEEFKKICTEEYPDIKKKKLEEMRRKKLGLAEFDSKLYEELHDNLLPGVDYTVFWRQLAEFKQSDLKEIKEENYISKIKCSVLWRFG